MGALGLWFLDLEFQTTECFFVGVQERGDLSIDSHPRPVAPANQGHARPTPCLTVRLARFNTLSLQQCFQSVLEKRHYDLTEILLRTIIPSSELSSTFK